MEVFWLQGYEATSLQDLLRAMHLSKSSFYQSFTSKEALFLRSLDRYSRRLAGEMEAQLQRAESGRAFIEWAFGEFTDRLNEAERRRGCFVVNSATEFAQRDPEIAALIAGGLERFKRVFRQALERARREGDLPADADVETLAYFLVSSKSGLKTMAKAGLPHNALHDVVQTVFRALGW